MKMVPCACGETRPVNKQLCAVRCKAQRILLGVSSFGGLGWFKEFRSSVATFKLVMMLQLQLLNVVMLRTTPLQLVAGEALIGVNLGMNGDNLPSIQQTVNLLAGLHAGAVRLYDANPEILGALQGSTVEVVVSIRNDEIQGIAEQPSTADAWIADHVVPFYPVTHITYISVGNEVLHEMNVDRFAQYFVQALYNVYGALVSRGMHDAVKVITPLSGEILASPVPPTNATFNLLQYVTPLLQFLQDTRSKFFINLYPYYAYMGDTSNVSLEFATFRRSTPAFTDPASNLEYYNLFDNMIDATYNAMAKVGFPDVGVTVGESGWPTGGGTGTSVDNARVFNQNLVRYTYVDGTPMKPDVRVPVFMFALFNENLKPGPDFEKFWGILNADGSPAYPLDLTMPAMDQRKL